jgi:hypothetical protein
MAERAPSRRGKQPAPPLWQTDSWSIWFSRLIQVVGLALVIYEALAEHSDRPVLLLVATSMMLGGVGLQLVLRWALGRLGP